jgi:hypothetical protein
VLLIQLSKTEVCVILGEALAFLGTTCQQNQNCNLLFGSPAAWGGAGMVFGQGLKQMAALQYLLDPASLECNK